MFTADDDSTGKLAYRGFLWFLVTLGKLDREGKKLGTDENGEDKRCAGGCCVLFVNIMFTADAYLLERYHHLLTTLSQCFLQ